MNDQFYFTVEKLIQVLEKLPKDLPILTHGFKEHFDAILEPVIRDVKYNEENEDYCGMFEFCEETEKDSIKAVLLIRDGR